MKNKTSDNRARKSMVRYCAVLFSFFMFALFPGICCAEEYHFWVAQVIKPDKKSVEFYCSSEKPVCKAVLPILAEGETEESELHMDFLVNQGNVEMRFVWKGQHLLVNEGVMPVPLERDEAGPLHEVLLFAGPQDTPEAVIRNGEKHPVAALKMQVKWY